MNEYFIRQRRYNTAKTVKSRTVSTGQKGSKATAVKYTLMKKHTALKQNIKKTDGPEFTRPACRYLLRARAGPQQQTRRPPLLLSIDGTDRQTDGRTLDRFMTLTAYCADS